MRISALLLVAALANPSLARAEDPPGLALAKQVVDEVRGDAHKEKMRIVWPETAEAAPPEGAEVVLITGYISYEMTRLVWHEGKVEARSVATSRTWFYNSKGEGFGAREFDVDPAAFAKAWSAARYVVGARDERIEPEPKDHEWTSGAGGGSHEPSEYVRMRLSATDAVLHASDPFGSSTNWEGVRDWDQLRDRAAFRCLAPLIPKDGRRDVPVASWSSTLTAEICRSASRLDLRYKGEHKLLLEVCLRVAGEVGGVETLAAVDSLESALRADQRDDWAAKTVKADLLEESEIAKTKLRLSTAWSSSDAVALVRAGQHEKHSQEDLTKWVRRQFRGKDPTGYAAFLIDELGRADISVLDVCDDLAEVRELRVSAARKLAAEFLRTGEPELRVAAARAVLAIDAKDAAAAAVLLAVLDDRPSSSKPLLRGERTVRMDALDEAVARGIVTAKGLRERLADAHSEDAIFVRALLEALARTPDPPTRDETLAAWRRVVEGPLALEARTGILALFELHDTVSRARIAATLDRMEAATKDEATCPKSVDMSLVLHLRHRLDEELPAKPDVK